MSEKSGNLPGDEESKQTKKGGCLKQGCFILILITLLLITSPFWFLLFGPSNEEREGFNKSRERILPQIGIKIMEFKEDRGVYPTSLFELIPKYIDTIPEELKYSVKFGEFFYSRNCDRNFECRPYFDFKYCGAPIDCCATYKVIENEFHYCQ